MKGTNFFVFFIKEAKKNKGKKLSKNNNKVKRLEVRDSPCRNPLSSLQWRQKTVLMSQRTLWKPQEEGMMSTTLSFPSV
jgi:hypothetical protein